MVLIITQSSLLTSFSIKVWTLNSENISLCCFRMRFQPKKKKKNSVVGWTSNLSARIFFSSHNACYGSQVLSTHNHWLSEIIKPLPYQSNFHKMFNPRSTFKEIAPFNLHFAHPRIQNVHHYLIYKLWLVFNASKT